MVGGDAAQPEGAAGLVEVGVVLLEPLHPEGPRVGLDLAFDLNQPVSRYNFITLHTTVLYCNVIY